MQYSSTDSIPHQKLISVLKCSGINLAHLHIICSYLTGRTQSVVVDGACSDAVVSGVPQGSVLCMSTFIPILYYLMFHSHLVQKLSCMLTIYCSTEKLTLLVITITFSTV